MQNLIPMSFEGREIRVVDVDGEPWFVGKDVAEALGYTNPNKAMGDHCKGVTNRYPLATAGGIQDVRILAEPDVLRLIVSSKLPEAQRFEAWVFEEVLPQIRKTGRFGPAPAPSGITGLHLGELAVEMRGGMELAAMLGLQGPQQILAATKAVRQKTGEDVMALCGTEYLPAIEKAESFNVTTIGEQIGLGPAAMNVVLVQEGLQIKNAAGKWEATERGRMYSEVKSSNKKQGRGTSIAVLHWYMTVLDVLPKHLTETRKGPTMTAEEAKRQVQDLFNKDPDPKAPRH